MFNELDFARLMRTRRNSYCVTMGVLEEVAAKMAAEQGYKDVIFLRGGHLSCHF